MNAGRVEKPWRCSKRAMPSIPKRSIFLQNMAIAQYRLGDKEGASESAEKALAIAGDDPKILNIAAQIFLQAENFEKAR